MAELRTSEINSSSSEPRFKRRRYTYYSVNGGAFDLFDSPLGFDTCCHPPDNPPALFFSAALYEFLRLTNKQGEKNAVEGLSRGQFFGRVVRIISN